MSNEDLIEYRLSQLELWKKEFVKENAEENKEIIGIVEALSLKIRDLFTKISTVAIIIGLVINVGAWFISNSDKIEYTQKDKDKYYLQVVSKSITELIKSGYLDKLEKKD